MQHLEKNMIGLGLILAFIVPAVSQELPKPTYANSVVISIEHGVWDSAEVDYIKANFPFGLYAWLSFSYTVVPVAMDWHVGPDNAGNGIQPFKDQVDALIAGAKAKNVKIHIVLVSGLARQVQLYREAKEEDVRNAQWYNDNKLASDPQIVESGAMNSYIFGTLSRYARKLRSNLEAKARAAAAFVKQRMDENPDVLVAASGWGEVELNRHRINDFPSIQDYFCDYSPFAVMEFGDWILHTGLYDDAAGRYAGQGYANGGAKYQGAAGLARFNADFGTNFSTWDLRYFHWSLADDWDPVPEDFVNADPNRISFSSYTQGGMMPATGPAYIPGGFDPPRTMQPGNAFWDLWGGFREATVWHFVEDMAGWVHESGIPAERWFSHQIPADYLFGTNPGTPPQEKNPRYYSSASPLWSAGVYPNASVGATIYDVKFPPEIFPGQFVRTTDYILPAIAAMSPDWAIMEYDAETYPAGFAVPQSGVNFILEQFMRVYDHRAHFINFWRWIDSDGEHTIKGMNKEAALRNFVRAIRDKARSTDLGLVFSPPKVIGLSGEYRLVSAGFVVAEAAGVRLRISGKIWDGEPWNWKDWGDLRRFKVFRSTTPNFPADEAHEIGITTEYAYNDATAVFGGLYYYKWQAENANGVLGPPSDELMISASEVVILGFVGTAGCAGLQGATVTFSNGGGTATTDAAGLYSRAVGYGWSGTAGPAKVGYMFLPVSRTYASVVLNQTGQDYAATAAAVVISGSIKTSEGAAVEGVTVTFSEGGGAATTDLTGTYSRALGYGWSGTATPSKAGYSFSPRVRTYGPVTSNLTNQDFAAMFGSPPRLAVSPPSLNFGAVDGIQTSSQQFRISNTGEGFLDWNVTDNAAWLTCSPAVGVNNALVTVTVSPLGLAPGTYAATITIASSNASNAPQVVAVSLRVGEGSNPPFGVVETPLDGTAKIEGSVPVTGWALDDIEVVSVKIYRDPVQGEQGGPNGYIFIGDAVFVTGARPDVEQIYASYPFNNRAGWGYMLLTNFLPNGGNGTFRLHAIATDREGKATLLGSRTISCDNAHAVLPFGAIDTPAQGGTASGSAFVNYGWVLTPPPNYIPYNGSTIWVWVDGVPLGHPNYGHYRVDIATLFPGYANANGAIGYRVIDTTQYPNGTHTIVWSARDSVGNEGGIGSRYFEIQNAAAAETATVVWEPASPSSLPEDPSGRFVVAVLGRIEIEVEELGRVVVKLRGQGGPRFVGWGENEDRELPIGSTLDSTTGTFRWIPGPGFFGRHVLHFAVTDGSARSAPVEVVVTIVPKKHLN